MCVERLMRSHGAQMSRRMIAAKARPSSIFRKAPKTIAMIRIANALHWPSMTEFFKHWRTLSYWRRQEMGPYPWKTAFTTLMAQPGDMLQVSRALPTSGGVDRSLVIVLVRYLLYTVIYRCLLWCGHESTVVSMLSSLLQEGLAYSMVTKYKMSV